MMLMTMDYPSTWQTLRPASCQLDIPGDVIVTLQFLDISHNSTLQGPYCFEFRHSKQKCCAVKHTNVCALKLPAHATQKTHMLDIKPQTQHVSNVNIRFWVQITGIYVT